MLYKRQIKLRYNIAKLQDRISMKWNSLVAGETGQEEEGLIEKVLL